MREIASHPARLPLVTFCRERNRLFPFDAATAGRPNLARLGIGDASRLPQLLPARVARFSGLDRLFDEKDACSSSHKSAFEFPELIVQALPDESEAVQHRRRGIAGKLLDQVLPIFLELPVGGRESSGARPTPLPWQSTSWTQGAGCRLNSSPGSSSRFSPPRAAARAPGLGWPSSRRSCGRTGQRSRS